MPVAPQLGPHEPHRQQHVQDDGGSPSQDDRTVHGFMLRGGQRRVRREAHWASIVGMRHRQLRRVQHESIILPGRAGSLQVIAQNGVPDTAKCSRNWWVRPVTGSNDNKAVSSPASSKDHRVVAARPAANRSLAGEGGTCLSHGEVDNPRSGFGHLRHQREIPLAGVAFLKATESCRWASASSQHDDARSVASIDERFAPGRPFGSSNQAIRFLGPNTRTDSRPLGLSKTKSRSSACNTGGSPSGGGITAVLSVPSCPVRVAALSS